MQIRFYSTIEKYKILDNFTECSFCSAEGFHCVRAWKTVEHYFQAMKSTDYDVQEWVRRAPTPGEAKQRGRSLKLRPEWEFIKEGVMLQALRCKFAPGTEAAKVLISTGGAELIEASPHDYYWGEGRDGTGQNRMGHLLMQVRSEIMPKEEEVCE